MDNKRLAASSQLKDVDARASSWKNYESKRQKKTGPTFSRIERPLPMPKPEPNFYKLVCTFKASFPVKKVDLSRPFPHKPTLAIHGFFFVHVSKEKEGYTDMGCQINEAKFDFFQSYEDVEKNDEMDLYWPGLGTDRFKCGEQFRDYQDNKHNYGHKHSKAFYLNKGLCLGKKLILKIESFMADFEYLPGNQYKCKKFMDNLEAMLQVKPEIRFLTLLHKSNMLGLKNIAVLFSDADWKPVDMIAKVKTKDPKTDSNSTFLLEDSETSFNERVRFKERIALAKAIERAAAYDYNRKPKVSI